MALLDYQRALSGLVVAQGPMDEALAWPTAGSLDEREAHSLAAIRDTPGLGLTSSILRSWNRGRAMKAAPLTLSLLVPSEREKLVADWARSHEARGSFFNAVALHFLTYLLSHLPTGSRAHAVCQFELAVAKADMGSTQMHDVPPEPRQSDTLIKRGHYASLVTFPGDPIEVLNTPPNEALAPADGAQPTLLLFAPGIPGWFRPASQTDCDVWRLLATPSPWAWLQRRFTPEAVNTMASEGSIA
jgi:hypothetical protein